MQIKTLKIDGMTCVNCEDRIERRLQSTKGITDAKVSYSSGIAHITYDENSIDLEEIISIIEKLDYTVAKATNQKEDLKTTVPKLLGIAVILLALSMMMSQLGFFNIFNAFPQAEDHT